MTHPSSSIPSPRGVWLITSHALLAAALCLAIVSAPARAQVTFDAASSQNTGSGNAGSLTWSHTTGSGSNRYLVVGVALHLRSDPDFERVSTVTYNGANLTFIGARN